MRVFDYKDYRAFLRDWFLHKKKTRPRWSLAAWARQLGLKGHSGLVMVLRGTRHPGPKLVTAFIQGLGLSPREAEYFQDLVRLQKVRNDPRATVLLMEKLFGRSSQRQYRVLGFDTFEAISHWHYYAIREMVHMRAFKEDGEWISEHLHFHVSPSEALRAIQRLLRLGLLSRDAKGKLKVSEVTVDTPSEIAHLGIQRFHEEMLANAAQSVRGLAPSERGFYGATFAMPREKLERAKELIRKFQYDFHEMVEEKGADAVYHLEIALFPLASES